MHDRTPVAPIHTAVQTLLEGGDNEADDDWVEVYCTDDDNELGT
jgi:hypothetical protein